MTSPPRGSRAVLEAARDVLVDHPGANLTEIAERSGVHRSTLHRHFPSREVLIEQLVVAAAEAFEQQVAAVDPRAGTAREAIRQATAGILRESLRWRVSRYAPLGTLPGGAAREGMRSRVLALLEAGQRDASVRDDLPAQSLYFAWLGLILTWGAFRERIEDPDAAAAEVLQVLLPEVPAVTKTEEWTITATIRRT